MWKVVPDFSSTLDDPRERSQYLIGNHIDMCRYNSREHPGYRIVIGELQGILESIAMDESTFKQVQSLLQTTSMEPCLQTADDTANRFRQ
jgi:hypothetical protein